MYLGTLIGIAFGPTLNKIIPSNSTYSGNTYGIIFSMVLGTLIGAAKDKRLSKK
ncbi:hypothetical protein SAMN04487886_10083 [Clostridium sp. DSM 8431]|uniref:hypothetical protein n=1 Tax=Clostridium sp. DSM 8431 TaxID=1761781 RepID=UPI0008F263AC|nr:hypothetical protein [Clostridium sp. DSM 8431]SFU32894.1 hypothetical protein SAMN04487886_10083 [Clostridium sp. DSM 8431]